jgi:polyisoprenoid-binding protein YceI
MNTMTIPNVQEVAMRYVVKSAISKFTVQAFAGGLLSSFGHNPVIVISSYSGEINLQEDDVERSSLQLTLQADSLRVASEMSDKDRREIERFINEQVLQVEQYPTIVFASSRMSASKTGEGQYWGALSGDLTMRGVTHGLTVQTRISITGDVLRASGNFSVLQSDYGIAPISVAGGSLKVKDELKFAFDIVARREA